MIKSKSCDCHMVKSRSCDCHMVKSRSCDCHMVKSRSCDCHMMERYSCEMHEATYPCKVKMWFIVSSNAVIHHLTTHRWTHRQTDAYIMYMCSHKSKDQCHMSEDMPNSTTKWPT